jgi:lambda family phage portal protein
VTRQQPRRKTAIRRAAEAVDAFVSVFAPAAALKRRASRAKMDALELMTEQVAQMRAFDGAERNEARADRWLSGRLSMMDAQEEDLEELRHRSRELQRSDSIGGAVDGRVNQVIGAGFTLQARIDKQENLNREIEALHTLWALRVDRTGRRSLWQQMRLAERCHAVDGEGLLVLSDVVRPGQPIPLIVEVIDVDRLMTPPEHANNPAIRLGIEYRQGEIVAYWIRRQSPFDSRTTDVKYDRIPANRVLHVFEPWFAEQSRGLPWMTRVLNRLRDIHDLDEACILAAQIESAFAVFIESAGGNTMADAMGASAGTSSDGQRVQEITPASINYLQKDQKVHFASPSRSGGNYGPFQTMNYRRVAGGINWPYEMVVKDWSGVSFAGGRLALTDAKVDCMVRRRLLHELAMIPIHERFMDEAVIGGRIGIDPREYNAKRPLFLKHAWMGPGWEYAINPTEDVKADKEAVDANFKTRAQVIAEKYGSDIEKVDEERARERKRERELDILPPHVAQNEVNAADPESKQKELELAGVNS